MCRANPTSPPAALAVALAVALVLLLAAVPAAAQSAEPRVLASQPPGSRTLIVGTKDAPPFSMKDENGVWSGLSIDLWRMIATDLELPFELHETDLPGLIAGLEDGSLDVSVAALTVTAAREQRIDFTHPFYSSGLGIAVSTASEGRWPAVLRQLLSLDLLKAVLGLGGLLLAIGALVWLAERRRNPEQFGPGAKGLGDGFWWSAVTMTTVGYGDKAPATLWGRAVGLVWMFASIVLISGFTAAIASALTVASLAGPVSGPNDLPDARVATLPRSTSDDYLVERGIRGIEYPTVEEAAAAVAAGEADAAVYDAPILRYLAARGSLRGSLQVLPDTFEPQIYAFGLPADSPLREALNQSLLRHTEGDAWAQLVQRYQGH